MIPGAEGVGISAGLQPQTAKAVAVRTQMPHAKADARLRRARPAEVPPLIGWGLQRRLRPESDRS